MALNGSPDNRNDLADKKSAPGAWRRSLAPAFLAMLIAAISRPEPALAQWDSVAGAVAGAMVRGMAGGGGYYSNGGGRRYSGGGRSRSHVAHARAKPAHVASHHERAAPVHHASSGGHAASVSEPAGPGGGSFH